MVSFTLQNDKMTRKKEGPCSWEVAGFSDSGTGLRWLSSQAILCLHRAISAHSHIHTVCPLIPPPCNFSSLPSYCPSFPLTPHFLSPLESGRVMWTAREEGWEKDERSVKEERDVVGSLLSHHNSLVRLASRSVCVFSCCPKTVYALCLSGWWSLHIPMNKCIYVRVWAWMCVLDVLMVHPDFNPGWVRVFCNYYYMTSINLLRVAMGCTSVQPHVFFTPVLYQPYFLRKRINYYFLIHSD